MKARFLALAALVLGLASCQKDFDAANVGAGGEVDFQLSVAAPELATRAGLDGVTPDGQADLNSAYGAIDYFQGGTAGDDLRRDWSDVNLRYTLEVYDVDENGNLVGEAPYAPVKDRQVIIVDEYKPVTFELRLVPKRHYRFVVFADFVPQAITDATQTSAIEAQKNIGSHHVIGNTLADIKVKNDGINDECSDAYFGYENFTITNSTSNDIVLKRPYGKLRVIATDLHELNLNVNPKKVKVAYTAPHLTNFDAVTGAATLDKQNTEVEFDSTYNDVYKEADKGGLQNHFYTTGYDALEGHKYTNANGAERHTHMTLFTDYILANNEVSPVHFTMTVYDRENKEIKSTTFNTDIPVQRNYLTTVIGNVLTTATEVEVRIDDNFAGENEVENIVFVNTAKEFQEALDNYVNGQTIILDADIKGNVTVDQVEGKDYVIDGNGYNYDGTIYIDGNSRNDGTETVIIRNFNFATDSSDINFIEQNSADGAVRYAHNVTIENCSFLATGVNVVAVKIRQGYNITIKNCVADGVTRANDSGMHSLGQFYGCTGITIDGVNFNNAGEGGVSFGTSTNVVVKNSTFVTGYYGVRADASVATTLTLENVNITAMVPVIARYCTADYTINISGKNSFEAPGYQVVFTKNKDNQTFEAPASNWVLNGGNGLRVFPGDKLFAYNAASLQYLLDNAVNGDTIELVADIEGDVTVNQKADVKIAIEGHGHNYAGVITVDGKSATYTTAGLTIKELNFKADAISADACIRLGKDNNSRYTCNVTVDSCIFDVPGAVGVKSYTGGDKNLKITNCTATANAHSLVQAKGIDGILVEKCNVYSKNGLNFNNSTNVTVDQCTVDVKGYAVRYGESSGGVGAAETYYIKNSSLKSAGDEGDAVIILRGTADYATLTITETTIDGTPAIVNNAKNAKVIIDGKEMIEAASQSELDVIAAAGVDVAVTLADGIYALPSIKNGGDVAIFGGKDVNIIINKPNMSGSDVTFTGVTVRGSGYATGVQHVNTVTYNNVTINGEMCLYGAKNVFNNCTFNLAANQYIWTYGSDVTEFNNCTFNTAGKAILVYNEGDGACEVKVDGCKFYASAAGYAGAIKNQACAAVEIDNFQSPTETNNGAAHKVTYTNTNIFDSNFSGGWRIKNYEAGNPITVNGVEYTQIAIDGKLMTIDAEKNVSVM